MDDEERWKKIRNYLSQISIEDIRKFAAPFLERGRRFWFIGNGGSAATVSHMFADLSKLGLECFCLVDNPALLTALANDDGLENIFVKQMGNRFKETDVLVVASVHGGVGHQSKNLVKACWHAKHLQGLVYALLGDEGGEIIHVADYSVLIPDESPYVVEPIHDAITHMVVAQVRNHLEYSQVKWELGVDGSV